MNTSGLAGTLSESVITLSVGSGTTPFSVSLNSTAAGRKIEVSVDGGVVYFQPTVDQSQAGQIVTAVLAPITHVKFTGNPGDSWRIL